MSYLDLAQVAMHRRNELEERINAFALKCDRAIINLQRLQNQTKGFVERLNCEPAELRERFLTCMMQLEEYVYVVTDFNLAIDKLEQVGNLEAAPVQDITYKSYPVLTPINAAPMNLLDVLSEPVPSTSTLYQNVCPAEKPRRKRIPREDQLLIAFSSTSCSAESVPEVKHKVEKEIQCKVAEEMAHLSIKAEPVSPEMINLPAQTMLQTDQVYHATIMSIDVPSFWIVTENVNVYCGLIEEMTSYYNENKVEMSVEEISRLTCCAIYDDDSKYYYRALLIREIEDETDKVEVFLVDTGECQIISYDCIQPIEPRFCTMPPYARCCHLAGIELLPDQDSTDIIKEHWGKHLAIKVDDNTSESLGVYIYIDANTTLNDLLVQRGFAVAIDLPSPVPNSTVTSAPVVGPPEFVDSDYDITRCPELDDPVKAVTGYSNRDEMDICKHYKGGPEKTCFKGNRCKKRHVLMHPDGWTMDKVAVLAKCRPLPLPQPATWHRVKVTYVCHFDRLYVQFIKDNEEQEKKHNFGVVLPPTTMESLHCQMNGPAARVAYRPLEMIPAPGEFVAALYPLDDQWYRAQVISCNPADQSIEVLYVDYGNVLSVKEDQVCVLEPRFAALPMQAVRCRLAGVVALSNCSKQWAAAKKQLDQLTQGRDLDLLVIARDFDELTVDMFGEDGYSLAENLAARKLVGLCDYSVEDDVTVACKVTVP